MRKSLAGCGYRTASARATSGSTGRKPQLAQMRWARHCRVNATKRLAASGLRPLRVTAIGASISIVASGTV